MDPGGLVAIVPKPSIDGFVGRAACSLVPGAERLERDTAERLTAEVAVEALE